MTESPFSSFDFDALYRGESPAEGVPAITTPPWDTKAPKENVIAWQDAGLVHGDVLDQPAYLLVTAEQHDELKRTSRMGDLVILGDGSLVYLTIPVKIHYGEDAEKIYSDALDLRELPTRW